MYSAGIRLGLVAAVIAATVNASACASSTADVGTDGTHQPADDAGEDSDSGSVPGDAADGFAGFGDGTVEAGPSCASGTEDVYVASTTLDLYRFQPKTLMVTKVGPMNCGTPNPGIVTMSVDRSGIAWVAVYEQVSQPPLLKPWLWKIRISDASCADKLAMDPGNPPAFLTGESFYVDPQNSTNETLFLGVDGRDFGAMDGYALGKVDTSTGKRALVGTLVGDNSASRVDLTGTGDGRLYAAIFPNPWQSQGTNAVLLSQRDPSNAASKSSTPITIDSAFVDGFVFWGGDFWFFLSPTVNPGPKPSVARYKTSDGSYAQVVPDLGFEPAGAGVSTCAPITPPK
jgi:hypothetical protein